jgi:signal transduction histidine kinase
MAMNDAVPVYLVGSPDGALSPVVTALGEAAAVVAPGGAGQGLAERAPGVVILDADGMRGRDLVELLSTLGAPWTIAVLDSGDPPSLRTLSLGARNRVEDVRSHLEDPASKPAMLLDLDRALREMARLRHDLNNPLTAAMAEAQLLLMDAGDDDARESLEGILQQLRRIRDMLAASRHLRPRRE